MIGGLERGPHVRGDAGAEHAPVLLDEGHHCGLLVDVLRLSQVGLDEVGEGREPTRTRLVLLHLDKLKLVEPHGLYVHSLLWIIHSSQGLDVRIHVAVVCGVANFLATLVAVKNIVVLPCT